VDGAALHTGLFGVLNAIITNGASLQVDGCEIQVARRKIKAQNMLKNRTSTISYYPQITHCCYALSFRAKREISVFGEDFSSLRSSK
jgi:hypothetical protein